MMDKFRAVDVSKCCLGFGAVTTSSINVTFRGKILPPSLWYRKLFYSVTTI